MKAKKNIKKYAFAGVCVSYAPYAALKVKMHSVKKKLYPENNFDIISLNIYNSNEHRGLNFILN